MARRARASQRFRLSFRQLFTLAGFLSIVLLVVISQRRAHLTSSSNEVAPGTAPGAAPRTSFAAWLPIQRAEKAPPPAAANPAREQAEARLGEAEMLLKNYAQATRYPPDSRPLREHPDRIHPLAPALRTLPLTSHGQASADVQVQLSQERLGLTGAETARLFVRCEDSLHEKVACAVQDARIMVAPHLAADRAARFPPAAIAFSDDGQGGDDSPNDGTHTATLQPMSQGFAGYSGPLHIAFTVQAGQESGELFFDLLYGATSPARFTGKVREAVEAGSLSLYVEVEVKQPGRYIITGRVDDSRDRPLAYAQFADTLAEGTKEVKLQVFGKLIRDEAPEWPLKLCDLDGFLLFEDRDPDREELPILAGVIYRSQLHSAGEFSAAEWQSEERDRHLKELGQDVDDAKSQLGSGTNPSP